jgi:hypothetical protein
VLKIRAAASLHEILTDTPTDLRARLKVMTGQNFRRINRFIELALIGAFLCRERAGMIAPDCALYLACDSSMLADSVKTLHGLLDERRPPSPFEFMNISGNMAGYYVGQQLGLNGPQLALHRNKASFEAALELLSLQSAQHRSVLIGYVEEGVWPLAEHHARLDDWPIDLPIAECSHWFYIDQNCAAPTAVIECCERYASMADAQQALNGLPADTQLSLGWGIAEEDAPQWLSALNLKTRFDPGAGRVYSTGLTAYALSRFIDGRAGECLLHLNRTDSGEYYAIILKNL